MLSAKTQRGQISNSRARSVEKKCRSGVRPLTGALLRVPLTTGARGAIRRPRRLGWRPPRPGVRCGRCERGGGGRGKRRAGPGGRRAAFADKAASCLARATGATAVRARWETLAAGARARGRRPGAKGGSPRRAAAGPCPAACRARRSPSGSRAPRGLKGRRGRHRGPLANRDSPTRFLQKPPFIRIYHFPYFLCRVRPLFQLNPDSGSSMAFPRV